MLPKNCVICVVILIALKFSYADKSCPHGILNNFVISMNYEKSPVIDAKKPTYKLSCKNGMSFKGSDEEYREVYCVNKKWKYKYYFFEYNIEEPYDIYFCESKCNTEELKNYLVSKNYDLIEPTNLYYRYKCRAGFEFKDGSQKAKTLYCSKKKWYQSTSYTGYFDTEFNLKNSESECKPKSPCNTKKLKKHFEKLNYVFVKNFNTALDKERFEYSCKDGMIRDDQSKELKTVYCKDKQWYEDSGYLFYNDVKVNFETTESRCKTVTICDSSKLVAKLEDLNYRVFEYNSTNTEKYYRYECDHGLKFKDGSEKPKYIYCSGNKWYRSESFTGYYDTEFDLVTSQSECIPKITCDTKKLKAHFENLSYDFVEDLSKAFDNDRFMYSCKRGMEFKDGFNKPKTVYCSKKKWYEDSGYWFSSDEKVNFNSTRSLCKKKPPLICSQKKLEKFKNRMKYNSENVGKEIRLSCQEGLKFANREKYWTVYCEDGEWVYDYLFMKYSIDVPYQSYKCKRFYCNMDVARKYFASLPDFLEEEEEIVVDCKNGLSKNISLSCNYNSLWIGEKSAENSTIYNICNQNCDITDLDKVMNKEMKLVTKPYVSKDERFIIKCYNGNLYEIRCNGKYMVEVNTGFEVDYAFCFYDYKNLLENASISNIHSVNSKNKK